MEILAKVNEKAALVSSTNTYIDPRKSVGPRYSFCFSVMIILQTHVKMPDAFSMLAARLFGSLVSDGFLQARAQRTDRPNPNCELSELERTAVGQR